VSADIDVDCQPAIASKLTPTRTMSGIATGVAGH
jgi:hypothetical protein